MFAAPKKDSDWGVGAAGSNWGDPRDPRGDPRTVPGVDIRGGNSDPRELRGNRSHYQSCARVYICMCWLNLAIFTSNRR